MFNFGSKKEANIDYKCTIRLLDDSEVLRCNFQAEHKGQYLMDYACNALHLLEKDYFGLRYVDSRKQRHWLDLGKNILKQVKGMSPIIFCFRVKFYPQDPHRLKEEITRYQIFLQLRRDLLHGRLYCSQSDAALLAAYIIQSELGDYDPEEHVINYVSEFKLLLKQSQRLEDKIAEIHQTQLKGQMPATAETNFLRKSCLLDTYGVDPHPVKDQKGNPLYLGINYAGILTFHGSRKTHHLKWADIKKLSYEGKMFIVHLLFNDKKHLVGFKCPSQAACHHLWKCAVEQRYFFTMESSSDVPKLTTSGGLFSRGCRFRFSGKVEKEVIEDTRHITRNQPEIQRSFTRQPPFHNRYEDGFSSLPYPSHRKEVNDYLITNCSDVITALFENKENMIESHKLVSTAYPEMSTDALDNLEEKCTTYSTNDSNHSETFTNNDCETSYESLRATPVTENSEEKNTEDVKILANACASHSRQETDDIVTLDVKIPKRKIPMSKYTHLPLHVNLMRITVLASLFVLLLLSCLLIVIMESESSVFNGIRKLTEIVTLRKEYYEPAKDYVIEQMNFLFSR